MGLEARLLLGHCSPRLSALSGPSRIGPTDHFEGIRASHIKGQTLVEMAGTHHRSLPVGYAGLRRCDTDDRMLRRYAKCLTDTNTTLHRLTASRAIGTVTLSAEAMEERLRAQLERGEVTMAQIRANYVRYCE